ncbi:MAG: bifunctional diaminohydroxyphosphoribosylaminopyrimidine deaminase/5-amino-6-(5-phosphoribosylamino)uracil reductase RibD [Vulcanimicrobiaceae bacterium]
MDFLEHAVVLAKRARGNTFPNPTVGAVLVKDGTIVGEGFHKYAGSEHAEVVALHQRADARGATLYVTLEPCAHQGRQPACTEAIIAAGLRRVVVGSMDPNPRTAGSGVAQLRAAGIDVEVCDDESCRRLVEDFAVWMTSKYPYVGLKMASSLDGFVGSVSGTTHQVTGAVWLAELQRLRYEYQAIMVGAGTALVDDPLLTVRDGARRVPFARIVVAGSRALPPSLRVFRLLPGYRRTIVVVADGAAAWVRELRELADIVVSPGIQSEVDLPGALAAMRNEFAIHSILCEGGPTLAGGLLASNMVNRFYWVIAPTFLAGESAVPVLTPPKNELRTTGLKFDLVERFGKDVLLSGPIERDV